MFVLHTRDFPSGSDVASTYISGSYFRDIVDPNMLIPPAVRYRFTITEVRGDNCIVDVYSLITMKSMGKFSLHDNPANIPLETLCFTDSILIDMVLHEDLKGVFNITEVFVNQMRKYVKKNVPYSCVDSSRSLISPQRTNAAPLHIAITCFRGGNNEQHGDGKYYGIGNFFFHDLNRILPSIVVCLPSLAVFQDINCKEAVSFCTRLCELVIQRRDEGHVVDAICVRMDAIDPTGLAFDHDWPVFPFVYRMKKMLRDDYGYHTYLDYATCAVSSHTTDIGVTYA